MTGQQTFTRGGYPLSGDPAMGRALHTGDDRPRCSVCGVGIYGDEEYLPNKCFQTDRGMGPHTYPNGEKCPDVLYVHVDVPDGHYLFRASHLLSPRGFDCDGQSVPEDVVAAAGDTTITPEQWALNVVDTVVVNLLLPLLPFQHTLREDNGHGNPVRLATIDGREVATIGEYERHALLSPHHLTVPVTALAALAHNYDALAEHDITEPTMIAASLAGLSVEEAIAAHAAGTLDAGTLNVMAALRS